MYEEHGTVSVPRKPSNDRDRGSLSVSYFRKNHIAGDVYLRYLRRSAESRQWRYSVSFCPKTAVPPLHHRIIQIGTKPFFHRH
jgi:hypothetical protein